MGKEQINNTNLDEFLNKEVVLKYPPHGVRPGFRRRATMTKIIPEKNSPGMRALVETEDHDGLIWIWTDTVITEVKQNPLTRLCKRLRR